MVKPIMAQMSSEPKPSAPWDEGTEAGGTRKYVLLLSCVVGQIAHGGMIVSMHIHRHDSAH